MDEKDINKLFDLLYRQSETNEALMCLINQELDYIKNILMERYDIVKDKPTFSDLYDALYPLGFRRDTYTRKHLRKDEGSTSWYVYMTERANFTMSVSVSGRGYKQKTFKKLSSLLTAVDTMPFEIIVD